MKTIVLALASLIFYSAASSALCRPQDYVLREFTGTRAIIGDCNSAIYHDTGKVAFWPQTGNWYHSNGAVAYWNDTANWYHANGAVAYWFETNNWYHLNGSAAFWSPTGNWHHANGKVAFWLQTGNWYHMNGSVAYWAERDSWYFPNGTFAGSSDKAISFQAVEFLLNDSCARNSSVLCYVALYH